MAFPLALPLAGAGGGAIVDFVVSAVSTAVLAATAPVDIVPLVIVGGSLAALATWHYWSQPQTDAILNKAKAKLTGITVSYQVTNDSAKPYSYLNVGGSSPSDAYKVTDTKSTIADYRYKIEYHNDSGWHDGPNIDPKTLKETPDSSKAWKDLSDSEKGEAFSKLTPSDWKAVIATMPQGGVLNAGQALPKAAIITGDPTSQSPSNQSPKVASGGSVVAPGASINSAGTGASGSSGTGTQNPPIAPAVAPSKVAPSVIPKTGVTINVFPPKTAATTPATVTPSNFSATGWSPSSAPTVGTTPVGATAWNPTSQFDGTSKFDATSKFIASPGAAVKPNIGTSVNTKASTGSAAPTASNVVADSPALKDITKNQGAILDGLVALTLIAKGIQSNVAPAAIQAASAAGTCSTTKPGGCMSNALNNAVSPLQAAQAATAVADGAAQATQLKLLQKISDVLGTEVIPTGGLVGGFKRFLSWTGTDRILNLVGTMASVHNAFMLSTSITDSFFSILDNLLNAGNLMKNSEAESIDTKEVAGKKLDEFFAGVFGKTEWEAVKLQFKKYNAIYSSVSQLFGNVRDIFEETNQIQQVTKNWVAELGNGMQDEGMLGEDNWKPKDDDDYKPKSKWGRRFQAIVEGTEKVDNVFQDLESVTGSLKSIVETANEVKANMGAIKAAVDEANKAAKVDRELKVEGLEIPNFSLDDLF